MTEIHYERPWLAPYQRAFLDDPARYTVVEASTKVGKTVGCIIWLVEQALRGRPGQNFWWVAPVYPQAQIAFRRLQRFLPPNFAEVNKSELRITLPNGSSLWFKTGENPDNLYGEDVYACVVDEATRCREEAWHAIRSTLTATSGPVKIIGNVKGRRNWAYDLARLAETGTAPGFAYYRLTAWDACEVVNPATGQPLIKREEIEDARRVLPVQVFKQDYEAIPADDGGNPFGLTAIEACVAPELSDGDPVIWGWDVAKSTDWTVGIALDRHGAVCRFERWQAPWRVTKRDIASFTRNCPAIIDSTGVGDPILEDLQAEAPNFTGFKFTSTSKQQLMERLAMAIQQHEVSFPAGPIKAELDVFEYEFTRTGVRYSAPEGRHDDCVCALALAVWAKPSAGSSRGLRAVAAAYGIATEDEPSDDTW